MKKLGLIAAMTSELNAMLEKFSSTRHHSCIGDRRVLTATCGDKEIYIVESGVGEILSAGATQYLISCCGVDAIVNFGVCGSLKSRHGLKKTVVCKGVVHYEMDTTAIDDVEVGRYCILPSTVIPLDEGLIALAQSINPSLEAVICASGNKFVADEKEKEYLSRTFDADVCEMEAAGIALTCAVNKVPCFMIKAVSDGEGGADDFRATLEEAQTAYTDFVIHLINTL